jgi:hypothetical protein
MAMPLLATTLRSFKNELVALVSGNHKIQCTLDGLGLRLGVQDFLGTLDVSGIQLKVFVRSLSNRHLDHPFNVSAALAGT